MLTCYVSPVPPRIAHLLSLTLIPPSLSTQMEVLSFTKKGELRIKKINVWPLQQSVSVNQATLIHHEVDTLGRSVAGHPRRQTDSSNVSCAGPISGSQDPLAFTHRRTRHYSIVPKANSLRFSFENEGFESRRFEPTPGQNLTSFHVSY